MAGPHDAGASQAHCPGRPKGTAPDGLHPGEYRPQLLPGVCLYALTLKAPRIGSSALRDFDRVNLARPILDRLRSETGETVHLSVLEPSGEIVYVAKVVSLKSIGVQTRLGQLSPSWCTATGRSILAHHQEIAERILSGPLEQRTSRTVTDPRELRRTLARVCGRTAMSSRAARTIRKWEAWPHPSGITPRRSWRPWVSRCRSTA